MLTRIWLLTLTFLIATLPAAAQQKPKDLLWTHAFDLSCRKFGEAEFTKTTQKFGVEAFKDTNNGLGVYLSQAGSLALAPGFDSLNGPIKDSKGPEWITGLDLPSREAGEREFTAKTKSHSLEVFTDPNVKNFLWITEKGLLAASKAGREGPKVPKWSHSVDLSARGGGVKEWKDAKKFGLEIYKDQSTNHLLYVSQTGHVAAIPEALDATPITDGKAPLWLHGLDLACRKHDEKAFTSATKKWGVEVYRDENNGNLIFLCETGSLAVIPGPKTLKAPTPNVKEPEWTHGLNLRVRSYGEKEFTDKTPIFGAEVFRDPNVNAILYVTEKGALAVAPAK